MPTEAALTVFVDMVVLVVHLLEVETFQVGVIIFSIADKFKWPYKLLWVDILGILVIASKVHDIDTLVH